MDEKPTPSNLLNERPSRRWWWLGLPLLAALGLCAVLAGLLAAQREARAEVNNYFITFAAGDVSFNEADSDQGTMDFNVIIFGTDGNIPTTVPYTVTAALQDPASPVDDFAPATGSLIFNSITDIKTIHVQIYPDALDEPDEKIMVRLGQPSGGNQADTSPKIGTIIDDDVPVASITNQVTVAEGDQGIKTTNLTVSLDRAPYQPVSVSYTTVPNSATPNADYVPVTNGVLNFTPSLLSLPVTINTLGDVIDESNDLETFSVQLTSPNVDAVAISPQNGISTISIQDDDHADFLVDPTSLITAEDGSVSGSFEVTVGTEPENVVTFTMDMNALGFQEGELDKMALTFDSSNWDQPQVVHVVGRDDPNQDGDRRYSIGVDPATSADLEYRALDPKQVSVLNRDDDGSTTYMVMLLKDTLNPIEFIESFDTSPSIDSWQVYRTTGSNVYWDNGRYVLEHNVLNYNVRTVAPTINARQDYEVQVKVEVPANADPSTKVGLLFDWVSGFEFYRFMVKPSTGQYFLDKYQGGYHELTSGFSNAIRAGFDENLLRVERRGSEIRLFVNGTQVNTTAIYDSTYQHGKGGLIIVAPPNMTAQTAAGSFDDFQFIELND
jgi:hypothetical protein